MSSIQYRPEIDGLRAVAVIPVVLFHMGLNWIAGGFLGVDVFFVISGYLITLVILKDYDNGVFKFSKFWLRRIHRIFPALVTMIIVTSLAGYFLMFRGDLNDLGKQGVASILSFANITMWRMPGGYWGTTAENSPFLHTWSLSVEEQFYFIYPFLAILVLTVMRRWILPVMLILNICSYCAFLYCSKYHPMAGFYLLPMRAWELLTGCLVAIIAWQGHFLMTTRKRTTAIMSLLGFFLVIVPYFLVSEDHRCSELLLVMPVVGAALFIHCCTGKSLSPVKGLLTTVPFVFVGKISYSLYLWHWPILVLGRQQLLLDGGCVTKVAILAIIGLISFASYTYVEKPLRQYSGLVKPAFFAFVLSLLLSGFLWVSNFSHDCSAYGEVVWKGQLYNVNPVDTWPDTVRIKMKGVTALLPDQRQQKAYKNGGVIKSYGGDQPSIVVLGDSHALMWSGVIDDICKELGVTVSFNGADGVSPFFEIPVKRSAGNKFFNSEEKYLFDEKRLACISEWKPRIVIIVAKWDKIGDVAITDDLLQFIGKTGANIILIEQPPELFFGDRSAPQYLSFLGITPQGSEEKYLKSAESLRYKLGQDLLQSIETKYTYCTIMPVTDVLRKKTNRVLVLDGSQVLYIDDDHLSEDGAYKFKARLASTIRRLLSGGA